MTDHFTPSVEEQRFAGVVPNTQQGQHFLKSQEVIDAICGQIPEGADCVEIGAGTGALTVPLLDRIGADGSITAYETDPRCIPVLHALGEDRPLTVRSQNFLDVDNRELDEIRDLYLVGNVPYHILEPLLKKMVNISFVSSVLMLPERFRDTVTAEHTGSPGWTKSTIVARAYFEVEPVIDAPREVFEPAPPVDSTVVTFKRLTGALDPAVKAYRAIADTLTTDETVASALKNISVRSGGVVDGSGLGDHQRHRGERRQLRSDFRDLAREWNQIGSLTPEQLDRSAGLNLLTVATKALGGKIDEINAPLGGVETTAIKRVCAAIEAAINRLK